MGGASSEKTVRQGGDLAKLNSKPATYVGPGGNGLTMDQMSKLSPEFWSKYGGANITYVTNNYYGDTKTINNTFNVKDSNNLNIVTGDGNTQTITNNDQDVTNHYSSKGIGHHYCYNQPWRGYYPPVLYPPEIPHCIGQDPYPQPDPIAVGLPPVMVGLMAELKPDEPQLLGRPIQVATGGVKPSNMFERSTYLGDDELKKVEDTAAPTDGSA